MPTPAQDASDLAGLQETLQLLGLVEPPADTKVVVQILRRMNLGVHPDKQGGNAALFAKLVAAKDLVLLKIEVALRRGEDAVFKVAGCLKWLKCQCKITENP